MTAEQFLIDNGVPRNTSIYVTLPATNRIPLTKLLEDFMLANPAPLNPPDIKPVPVHAPRKLKTK